MATTRVPALLSSMLAVAFLACGGGSVPTKSDEGSVTPLDVPFSEDDASTDTDVGSPPDALQDTAPDTTPDAGPPAALPCVTDTDCPPPGLCVESPDGGKYCATGCDACPAGWTCRTVDTADGPKDLCLPFDSQCRPCAIDDDCRPVAAATRDRCVPFSPIEGSFCARDCPDGACPAGYACQQVTRSGGVTEALCMPKSGVCACSQASIDGGFRTPCARTGTAGTCAGWRECAAEGLTACSAPDPVAEVCENGTDDNCDGQTDEAGCQGCRTFFLDADGDGWGVLGQTKCLAVPEGDYSADRSGDCDDTDAGVHPDVKESCNGRDDDCNGLADDASPVGCESYWVDADADGHGTGEPLCLCKAAGQFTATTADDCDDANPAIHPGTGETCGDGRDDDCDGQIDEAGAAGCTAWYVDADQDGHGAPGEGLCLCKATGPSTATTSDDCDDSMASTAPGAPEVCANGRDDDCDGSIDEEDCQGCTTYFQDQDADGYGVAGDSKCLGAAADGYTAVRDGDCEDGDATIHPGAAEACDGKDQDCDGTTDPEGAGGCFVFFDDADGDGWGASGGAGRCLCKATGTNTATTGGDCDETNVGIHPDATETCNGLDDDCDGDTDPAGTMGCTAHYLDLDRDGWGTSSSKCLCGPSGDWVASRSGDCDDGDPSANPGGIEKCETGRDEDCNGQTDEAGCQGCTTFYKDQDGDGYGVASDSQCLGEASGTYSSTMTGDCSDGDGAVNPAAAEACNKKDDDCDGQTDDGGVCQVRIGINADDGRSGGAETGACWCICEDDYNFKIADKFREWLDKDTANAAGGGAWSVWMARKSLDENPSLQSRIDYFNNNDVDRIVTLSGNSYPNPGCGTSVAGTETWITAAAGATTKDLANRVQAAVVAALGNPSRGVKTDTNKSYAILDKTTASSVYLFYGFVTNYGDVDLISDPAKRDAAGLALLQAIQGSFGLAKFKP